MTDEPKRFYKRKSDKGDRASRFTAAGVGVFVAASLAFWLDLKGVKIPPGLEAGAGGFIAAFFACMHDVLRFWGYVVKAWVLKTLQLPPPPEDDEE